MKAKTICIRSVIEAKLRLNGQKVRQEKEKTQKVEFSSEKRIIFLISLQSIRAWEHLN